MDDYNSFGETDAINKENPLIENRTIAALFSDENQAEQAED